MDSTGLKIRSDAGWHNHKHGVKGACKTWRKLHLALDPDSGVILASELTTEQVGDETALSDLVGNIDARVDRFVADGAYDGTGISDIVTPLTSNDAACHEETESRGRHLVARYLHYRAGAFTVIVQR